jgi:hypothetical protein
VGLHAAPTQLLAEVPVLVWHIMPQPPQCAVVTRRSVSQPLTPLESQFPCVAAQVGVHMLPAQVLAVVPVGRVQATPQALQLEASVVVLTQLPEQLVGVAPPQQRLAPMWVLQVSPPPVQVLPGSQHTRPSSPQVAEQE